MSKRVAASVASMSLIRNINRVWRRRLRPRSYLLRSTKFHSTTINSSGSLRGFRLGGINRGGAIAKLGGHGPPKF